MKVRVHWIIDGVMEIEAETNEDAEASTAVGPVAWT